MFLRKYLKNIHFLCTTNEAQCCVHVWQQYCTICNIDRRRICLSTPWCASLHGGRLRYLGGNPRTPGTSASCFVPFCAKKPICGHPCCVLMFIYYRYNYIGTGTINWCNRTQYNPGYRTMVLLVWCQNYPLQPICCWHM